VLKTRSPRNFLGQSSDVYLFIYLSYVPELILLMCLCRVVPLKLSHFAFPLLSLFSATEDLVLTSCCLGSNIIHNPLVVNRPGPEPTHKAMRDHVRRPIVRNRQNPTPQHTGNQPADCSTRSIKSPIWPRIRQNTHYARVDGYTLPRAARLYYRCVELGKFDPPLWHAPYGRIV